MRPATWAHRRRHVLLLRVLHPRRRLHHHRHPRCLQRCHLHPLCLASSAPHPPCLRIHLPGHTLGLQAHPPEQAKRPCPSRAEVVHRRRCPLAMPCACLARPQHLWSAPGANVCTHTSAAPTSEVLRRPQLRLVAAIVGHAHAQQHCDAQWQPRHTHDDLVAKQAPRHYPNDSITIRCQQSVRHAKPDTPMAKISSA